MTTLVKSSRTFLEPYRTEDLSMRINDDFVNCVGWIVEYFFKVNFILELVHFLKIENKFFEIEESCVIRRTSSYRSGNLGASNSDVCSVLILPSPPFSMFFPCIPVTCCRPKVSWPIDGARSRWHKQQNSFLHELQNGAGREKRRIRESLSQRAALRP